MTTHPDRSSPPRFLKSRMWLWNWRRAVPRFMPSSGPESYQVFKSADASNGASNAPLWRNGSPNGTSTPKGTWLACRRHLMTKSTERRSAPSAEDQAAASKTHPDSAARRVIALFDERRNRW